MEEFELWKNHILAELERLSGEVKDHNENHVKIIEAIAELKVRAGIWGLMGGMIPVIIAVGITLIK